MSKPIKLPSGSWRVQWFDSTGKRRSATFTTVDAAKAALRRRETEVDDIRAGRARPRSNETLRDVYEGWLASREPAPGAPPDVKRRRGNRVRDNRNHLKQHILPALGDKRLPEINADVVKAFVQQLEGTRTARKGEVNDAGRTLKPGTIQTVIITLRKMMNDLGYPLRVSYKVPETSYQWLRDPAHVGRFLDACGDGWFRVACELAVYAGLRQGEVAGLRWQSIDHDLGLIHVDRSYCGPTKSKHVRAVPLAPELAKTLKRWRLASGAASNAAGGLVVLVDGEMISEHSDLGKRVRRRCKKAGVDPVTFHQLRHTFASHLAQRVALPIVGAVLGHADPKTTARYAHVDTASMARDPRLHLTFTTSPGTVSRLDGAAHELHTAGKATSGSGSK